MSISLCCLFRGMAIATLLHTAAISFVVSCSGGITGVVCTQNYGSIDGKQSSFFYLGDCSVNQTETSFSLQFSCLRSHICTNCCCSSITATASSQISHRFSVGYRELEGSGSPSQCGRRILISRITLVDVSVSSTRTLDLE